MAKIKEPMTFSTAGVAVRLTLMYTGYFCAIYYNTFGKKPKSPK